MRRRCRWRRSAGRSEAMTPGRSARRRPSRRRPGSGRQQVVERTGAVGRAEQDGGAAGGQPARRLVDAERAGDGGPSCRSATRQRPAGRNPATPRGRSGRRGQAVPARPRSAPGRRRRTAAPRTPSQTPQRMVSRASRSREGCPRDWGSAACAGGGWAAAGSAACHGGGWVAAGAVAHGVGGAGVNGSSAGTGSAGAARCGAGRASKRRSSRSSAWAAWAWKKPTMPSAQPAITSKPRRMTSHIVAGGSRSAGGSRNSREGIRARAVVYGLGGCQPVTWRGHASRRRSAQTVRLWVERCQPWPAFLICSRVLARSLPRPIGTTGLFAPCRYNQYRRRRENPQWALGARQCPSPSSRNGVRNAGWEKKADRGRAGRPTGTPPTVLRSGLSAAVAVSSAFIRGSIAFRPIRRRVRLRHCRWPPLPTDARAPLMIGVAHRADLM